MANPELTQYDAEITQRVVAILTTDASWTSVLAQVSTDFSSGPTITAPTDSHVEICLADLDDIHLPQRYPAVRVAILDSNDVAGVNHGVGRTLHSLELRTFTRTTDRSAVLAGRAWIDSTATLRADLFARAAQYIMMRDLAGTVGVYEIQANGGSSKQPLPSSDGTVLRISRVFNVWQRTRSSRFGFAFTG